MAGRAHGVLRELTHNHRVSAAKMTSRLTTRTPALTATHFYNFLMCPHRVYLDEYGDKNLMDEESDFEKLLWERGVLHEEDVLEKLGLEVVRVDCETPEECEQETLRLMKKGERLIYQGLVCGKAMRGRPDLLERTKGESGLGSYYYVPVELKSGSAYANEESGKLKEEYALQLSFYADALREVQGTRPAFGKIIDGDFQTIEVQLEPFGLLYGERLAVIQGILTKRVKSEPAISSTCGQCHWRSYCIGWAKQVDDPTLVRKVNGAKRAALRKGGIRTVAELARLGGQKPLPAFEGISAAALRHMTRRAKVLKSGTPLLVNPVELPKAGIELFFDIETEPLENICYLYGVVERRGKRSRYVNFFADSPEMEEDAWREFWDYIAGLDDYHMYHYAPYEKRELNRLLEHYPCDETLFNDFFSQSTDLYRLVDRHTDWPSYSYSIKAVSKFLGFNYSEVDPGGLKAARWYMDYIADPVANAALKERILQYNREDCEAMVILKDWLVEQSRGLTQKKRP